MEKPENEQLRKLYWRKVVLYFIGLMVIWFLVLVGSQILLKDSVGKTAPGQFDAGLWFANHGIMYLFVGIVVVFLVLIKRLDKKYKHDQP